MMDTAEPKSPSEICWAFGVQQLIASACRFEATAFLRCCETSGVDPCQHQKPLRSGEQQRICCQAEHSAMVRCVSCTLHDAGSGGKYDACKKDFSAMLGHGALDAGRSAVAHRKAWACAWKHFKTPLHQLMVTAHALGECRPSRSFGAGRKFQDSEFANEARYREMWKGTAL
eukprot:TRINITY_DN105212_c0_g1_i1.p1 TRINITY_DN105212_c0_g1~~TRINITY_DN105212_c0_g1_i1.p1  ORF type:complete len:172 (+),score=28.07 TRINITY_DN105212_c0_g1_i1:62-577(+)